jgi:hypothetical protein
VDSQEFGLGVHTSNFSICMKISLKHDFTIVRFKQFNEARIDEKENKSTSTD